MGDTLKSKIQDLINEYTNEINAGVNGWMFYEDEKAYDREEARLKKLEDVVGDLNRIIKKYV
jgi:glutathionyl-hydroquinone reductase